MSIRVSSIVWERSTLQGADLLLLLAIADQANDEGEAWPGLDTLQGKLRFGSRQGLLACIARVVAAGELTKTARQVASGRDTTNMYRIEVGRLLAHPQRYYYTHAERAAAKAALVSTPVDPECQPQLTLSVNPSCPKSLEETSDEPLKEKDMSSGDDAPPSVLPMALESPNSDSPKTEPQITASLQKSAKQTGRNAGQKKRAVSEESSARAAPLFDLYNEHRGALPRATKLTADRVTMLAALADELGDDAGPMLTAALKHINAKPDLRAFYEDGGYGLNTVANERGSKVVKYAEAYRPAPTDNPMNRRKFE